MQSVAFRREEACARAAGSISLAPLATGVYPGCASLNMRKSGRPDLRWREAASHRQMRRG